ncbi:hypothetical protein C8P63_12346 [Melghirimyces profundicolus]|uniref:Uncharacterized protein n=1 Tax=Melghirimyces profundicolus TaxID=1242148 RepID=A0A2T6BG37_9BACL|nr:hypothetical protein [Melghirimyces profundicolus]PTX55024.1 hypothetical protein C8P63_12346 [Melghirimyces profundicolus]
MKSFGTVLLAVALFLPGMWVSGDRAAAEPPTTILEGRMHYLDIQGGCWVLVEDRGRRFELVAEPALLQPLKVEGLRVTVEVRPDSNLVGKCMAGRMVRLIRIIRAETSPAPESWESLSLLREKGAWR